MPTARYALGVAAVNGILYAVGGLNSVGAVVPTLEAYDPTTNTWTTKAPMPTARFYLGVAAVNGILYAVGGFNSVGVVMATLEAYDPTTNTWTTQAPMPTARSYLGVAAVNGMLYAVGGLNNSSTFLATVEAYNPATNTWTTTAPMPTARNALAAGAVNGMLYAVGGYNGSILATVEAYDPVTNTWTTQAPMPTARYGLGVAAISGTLYAVGGCGPTCPAATMEAYDPAPNTWTTQAPMPTARWYLGVDVIVGTLYAVGGYTGTSPSAANEAFTALGPPATLTLSPLAATNTVGTRHCVTATVKDAAGNPVPGVTVRFSVGPSVPTTFPSPSSGSSTTTASGQATFCYTASLPGLDRIHAYADANNNGTQDPTEPFGDAEKTWTPPASTQFCEVTITNGGWIIANNTDQASFGGNAKVLADGTVQGQEQYQDHGPVQPMNVHSTQITATTCSQDRTTASIFGQATIDGGGSYVFRIDVTDGGPGGGNDTYGIMLETGYVSGQHSLGGGNVTIH